MYADLLVGKYVGHKMIRTRFGRLLIVEFGQAGLCQKRSGNSKFPNLKLSSVVCQVSTIGRKSILECMLDVSRLL